MVLWLLHPRTRFIQSDLLLCALVLVISLFLSHFRQECVCCWDGQGSIVLAKCIF